MEKHGIHLWNVSAKEVPRIDMKFFTCMFGIKVVTETRNHFAGLMKMATEHINATLSRGEWDLVITHDLLTVSLSCVNSLHKFPHFHSGTVLIKVHLLPAWQWPGLMPHGAATSDNLTFKDRALNIIKVLGMRVANYLLFSPSLAEVSEYCPSMTVSEALSQIGVTIPYIVPNVLGLEYPTTLTEYTGPLIAQATSAPLTGELKEWL